MESKIGCTYAFVPLMLLLVSFFHTPWFFCMSICRLIRESPLDLVITDMQQGKLLLHNQYRNEGKEM